MDPTSVGVIGSGNVGRALARGFASRGHAVMIGSRSPDKPELREWLESDGEGIRAGTFEEVARHAELAVLATLGAAVDEAIAQAGPENLAGKVLIDATNPLQYNENGPPTLIRGHTDSGGEHVQRLAADARVVKAFNIVNFKVMVDPDLPGGPPDMFIAGNDDGAKATVTEVLESFGWPRTWDIGGIDGARQLESLCLLWVAVGVRRGAFDHAFKLLSA
jgi:predicted dinucleotide-binding enzyme